MELLLFYLLLALVFSFLCSLTEAVLLSVPLSFLKAQADGGSKSAAALARHKENVEKPLSAILSLNTIAHTVGAAGVGAQAMVAFPVAAMHMGQYFFGIVSAALTLMILVFTEIIPKTLGANYAKRLIKPTSSIIGAMIFVLYPLVWASAKLTKGLSLKEKEHTTSREEIAVLSSIGAEEGIVGDKENKIIQNLIKLKDIKVSEIMTPRIVVVVANEDMSLQDFLKDKEFLYFSRIPIYQANSDNITGYVFREQVFEKLAEDQFNLCLRDISRRIITFAHTTTLFEAWETMLACKEHISIVLDEYGGMNGIVSIEDVIESLLGVEIIDEKDKVEDMQQYALERWRAKQKKYEILKKEE
jgi:CBS domain containing-hemolysin-like protein